MKEIKRKIVPISVSELKTGTSSKDGKSWKWTLYKVQAKVLPKDVAQDFTTFDDFRGREGTEVEVEIKPNNYTDKQGVEHKGWQISLPKRSVWDAIADIEKRLTILEGQGTPAEVEPETKGDVDVSEAFKEDDIPF